MVDVELVYVPTAAPIVHLRLTVSDGMTVGDVIEQSGLLNSHPEIHDFSVGIFSKSVDYHTPVRSGDRIEIYRPLLVSPMEKRRQRARKI